MPWVDPFNSISMGLYSYDEHGFHLKLRVNATIE